MSIRPEMSGKAIHKPGLLLLAGQQQNVGKTTLACNIISHFSRQYPITAIKVTPHFHQSTAKAETIAESNGYQILKEISELTNKDTSRMLKAGAEQSFLLQAHSDAMKEALLDLLSGIPSDHLVVCESAGVREHINPGVFLALRQLHCKVCSIEDENMFNLADRIVTYTVNGFDISMNDITVKEGGWKLTN